MKKIINKTFLCATVFCVFSCKDNSNDSKNTAKEENNAKFDTTGMIADANFAVAIADGGSFEVAAARLAQSNASAANVKAFAQQMITDHSAAGNELKEIAAKKNITLPGDMSTAKQKKYNDLAAKKGDAFDKVYVDCMIDEHKEAVDAFQKETDKGTDNEFRAWASAKLPTIQHHLEMIKAIRDNKQ